MRARKRTDLTSAVLPAIILAAVSTGVSSADDSPAALAEQSTVVRYKEEPVQWTPHSVSVIEADEIEATYRRDLENLESRVPGMIVDRMHATPRGAAIALRGLGSNDAAKSFDPAVAVKVDGVYVGTHTGRLQVLFDFDQIEVTRGPNGARDRRDGSEGARCSRHR
jgi:iron complex outermembrane receptor protein